MDSLAKTVGLGTLWASVSSVLIKVVGLATIFIVLHRLSVYEYGLTELAMSILSVLSFFLLPGLTDVVIADMGVQRGKGEVGAMRSLFENYFIFHFLLGVVAWAVMFFGAGLLSLYFEGQIVLMLRILSFSFLVSPFRTMYTIILSVHFQFFWRSFYSLTEEFFKLGIVVLCFALYDVGPVGLVVAVVGSQLLVVLAMLPLLWRLYGRLRRSARQPVQTPWALFLAHGKWSVLSSYFNSLGQNLRLFLIRLMLGTEAVGLFAVAQGLYNHTASLLSVGPILSPIIPQYVSQRERFDKLVSKGVKYQLLAYLGIGLVAVLVFPVVIVYLFPHYASAMTLFRVMLLALIPASFAAVISPIFFALKAQKNLFWAIMLKNVWILVFAPLFIGVFGVIGIAIEFVSTVTFYVMERYKFLRRLMPDLAISPRAFLTVDEVDRMIVERIGQFAKRQWSRLLAVW